jgi:hypothetical protein
VGTAKQIKSLSGWRGDARLYRVDPPMKCWDKPSTEYVIVSATIVAYSGPETYIFAADETGTVTDWSELSGSQRGPLDHVAVLRDAGYEVSP